MILCGVSLGVSEGESEETFEGTVDGTSVKPLPGSNSPRALIIEDGTFSSYPIDSFSSSAALDESDMVFTLKCSSLR